MPKDKPRNPHALYCDDPSLTHQSFKEECDINKIVSRARDSGQLPTHVNTRAALYGDFSNVPSYQDALNMVERARGLFMSLPSNVRERFSNDPAKMIQFLQDPKNRAEAIALGLVVTAKADSDPQNSTVKAPSSDSDTKTTSKGGKGSNDAPNS